MTAAKVWAANGSNEIQQQLLLAFGGAGGPPWASRRRTRCTRLLARAPAPAGSTGTGAADFQLDAGGRQGAGARFQPDVVFVCSPNNPTGTAVGLDTVDAIASEATAAWSSSTRRTSSSAARAPAALTLLPALPAAGRDPHHEQGVRVRRGAGGLPRRPTPRWSTPATGTAALPPASLTQAAARAALAPHRRAAGQVEAIKAQRDRIVTALRELGLTRAERRQLRPVRTVPGREGGVAGPARPGRAGPRRRPARLAAGHRRHAGGDRRVPAARWVQDRAGATARLRETEPHEPHCTRRAGHRRVQGRVELDLDGTGRTDIPPASASTTTCSPQLVASTAAST